MDIRPDDVQIAAIPLSHSYGIGNLVMPLLLQGTAICLRDAFVPQRIPDDARQFNARHLPGAPFMFDHLATHPPPGGWPPSLTRLVSAGAPLDPGVAERFRRGVWRENSSVLRHQRNRRHCLRRRRRASDGGVRRARACPASRSRCVTQTTHGGGRVHVRSAAVSSGYAGDDDADAFVDGGFLTTDLGGVRRRPRPDASRPRLIVCQRRRAESAAGRGRARAAGISRSR